MKQNRKKYFVIGNEKNKAIFKDGSSLDLHHHFLSGTMVFGERFTIELPCNYSLVEHNYHINRLHGLNGKEIYLYMFELKNGLTAHEVILEWLERKLEVIESDFKLMTRLKPVLDKLREEID